MGLFGINWAKYKRGNGYWTGRSSLYKNQKQVDYVVNELNNIKTSTIVNCQSDIQEKVQKINNCFVNTGFSVEVTQYDALFDTIGGMVGGLQQAIHDKQTNIEEYAKQTAEQPFKIKTILATGGMVISKFGEGFVSTFEDIGDAALTVTAGWGSLAIDALMGSNLNEGVSKFIAKDLSNEVFTGINDITGISKYSAITADSGFANIAKGAGVATGYLTMSGWLSGVGEGLVEASKVGEGLGKASKVGKFLSSTTNANTVVAAFGGYGGGMENNLQAGNTFLGSQWGALKQAAVQGGTAYAMGKLGEHIDKVGQQKAAQKALDSVDDDLRQAQAELTFEQQWGSQAEVDAAQMAVNEASAARKTAAEALENINNTKVGWGTNSTLQGYKDPITMNARQHGVKFGQNVAENGFRQAAVSSAKDVLAAGKDSLKNTWTREVTKTAGDAASAATTEAAEAAGSTATETAVETTRRFAPVQGVKETVKDIVYDIPKKVVTTVAAEAKSGIADIAVAPVAGTIRGVTGAIAANASAANATEHTAQYRAALEGKDLFQQTMNGGNEPEPGIADYDPYTGNDGYYDTPAGGDTGANTGGDTGGNNAGNNGGNNNGYNGGGSSYPGGGYTGSNYEAPATSSNETFNSDGNTSTGDGGSSTTPGGDTGSSSSTTPSNTSKDTTGGGTTHIVTPSNPSDTTTPHTGGGYSGSGGYSSSSGYSSTGGGGYQSYSGGNNCSGGGYNSTSDLITTAPESIDEAAKEAKNSIDEIIKGNKYTKIPTAKTPISTNKTSSGGSSVIPIAAGLSAAAAAGIGAKAYMDRKNNNGTSDDYDDDIEEWSDEDTIDLNEGSDESHNYEESDDYLNEDDEYGYQTEEVEKYGARNSEELADLQ